MSRVAKHKALTIADQQIPLGQSRTLNLKFSESYLGSSVSVPIQVIRAKKNGPTVLLAGCVHGDELNGLGIIREVLFDTPPTLEMGSLVCVPVINVYGLEHHTRYLPDRRDLNRSFPGNPSGSLSSRLAGALFTQVIANCDYVLDFHSAAVRRTNYPNIRADYRIPGVQLVAEAFGCELIVDGKGPLGSLRRAATDARIPCVILEAGEVWKIEPRVVEVGVRGILNVLKSLRMIPGEIVVPRFQTKIRRSTWVRAEIGGTLGFHVNPGDLVERGQILATNYNIFGAERRQITSPNNGIVLGMSTMPVVKPGDAVFHIAMLSKSTCKQIKTKIGESSSRDLFSRVQSDLATNVHDI